MDERKQASRTLRLGVLGVDRWRRVEAVLDAALDLPAERVAAFLDDACHGDGELRAQVETLLEADARGDAFLSRAGRPSGDGDRRAAGFGCHDARRGGRIGRRGRAGPPRPLHRAQARWGVAEWGSCTTAATKHSAAPWRSSGCPSASRAIPTGSRDSCARRSSLASLHHPNIAAIRGVEQSPAGTAS